MLVAASHPFWAHEYAVGYSRWSWALKHTQHSNMTNIISSDLFKILSEFLKSPIYRLQCLISIVTDMEISDPFCKKDNWYEAFFQSDIDSIACYVYSKSSFWKSCSSIELKFRINSLNFDIRMNELGLLTFSERRDIATVVFIVKLLRCQSHAISKIQMI